MKIAAADGHWAAATVVKELENAVDAQPPLAVNRGNQDGGCSHMIRVTDSGWGIPRRDTLAFLRHAQAKSRQWRLSPAISS